MREVRIFELVSNEHLLEHNRQAADALVRIKKRLIVMMVVLGATVLFLLPTETAVITWGVLLAVIVVAVIAVEVMRARIFKRDVHERSERGDHD